MTTLLAPSGIDLELCDGSLTINGVDTRGPGWWLVALTPALAYGTKGGSNRPMPTSSGERAYRRRRRGRDFTFRMVFGGRYTAAGAPSANPGRTLQENLLAFTTNVVADTGTATVPSVLTTLDGVAHSWPVQVLDLVLGEAAVSDDDAALLANLLVRVPRGGWIL